VVVSGNALGFATNAPVVLGQNQGAIANFAISHNVAAVQADVVAHSMGGDIVRTMSGLSNFVAPYNYGLGPIHKLITIGTPYEGSPVAGDLLPYGSGDPNACVRNVLANFSDVALQSATVGGNVIDGAIADLVQPSLPTSQLFRTAYIAGSTTSLNLAQLDSSLSRSQFLYATCGGLAGDPRQK
jgi:hypothetical protein